MQGGLGKFRYGGKQYGGAEGVVQAELKLGDLFHAVTVLRAEPQTRSGADALETYLRYDDIGWASPYTLTPSAISSWIGDECAPSAAKARCAGRAASAPFH